MSGHRRGVRTRKTEPTGVQVACSQCADVFVVLGSRTLTGAHRHTAAVAVEPTTDVPDLPVEVAENVHVTPLGILHLAELTGGAWPQLTREWAITAGTRRYTCRCGSRVVGALEMAEMYADAARLGQRRILV